MRETIDRHALLLIVGTAAILRFATLAHQSYWYDESVTVDLVRHSFGGMLSALPSSESNPPLYYVLAWPWSRVLGDGEAGLRSLSALLGIATVPVLYAAGRELASRRAGLIAAALAAVNPLLIWYSQEARSYALLLFTASLSLLFFARALDRGDDRTLAGWALTSCLALASHYLAAALVFPEAAWLVLRGPRRSAALASAAPLAAALALAPLALAQRDHTGWIADIGFGKRLAQVPELFVAGNAAPRTAIVVAACAVAAIALAAGLRGAGSEARAARLGGGLALAGLALVVLVGALGHDVLLARNVLALWAPAAVALAAALASPRLGSSGLGIAVALCALGLGLTLWVNATPDAQRTNWDDAAALLGSSPRARAVETDSGYYGKAMLASRDDLALTPPGGGPKVREVVTVTTRPVTDRSLGPCWWGSQCTGGHYPIALPRTFELRRTALTDRLELRFYATRRPTALGPRTPASFLQRPAE